jgi:hypothetical protein
VIGDDARRLGTLTAAELLSCRMTRSWAPLLCTPSGRRFCPSPSKKLTSIALHHRVAAMSVVDDAGHLLGPHGGRCHLDRLGDRRGTLLTIDLYLPGGWSNAR